MGERLNETFNARIRAECLNASWFLSLADAQGRIEAWRIDYNTKRPHFGLGPLDARGLHPPKMYFNFKAAAQPRAATRTGTR
jgi:transposase InsO family protein